MSFVGIDIGRGNVKAVGDREVLFTSAVGTYVEGVDLNLKKKKNSHIVEYEGNTYVLGESAKNTNDVKLAFEKWQDNEYFLIQLLTAAALSSDDDEIYISSGVAIADKDQRKAFKDKVTKQEYYTLKVNGKERTLNIKDVYVTLQGMGVFLDQYLTESGTENDYLEDTTVGIVNVGFRDVNFCIVDQMEFTPRFSYSTRKGMYNASDEIIDKINSKFDYNLGLDDMTNFFEKNHSKEQKSIITKVLAKTAKSIRADINTRWNNMTMPPEKVFYAGAASMYPHFKDFYNAEMVKEPQFAEARGYYKIAKVKFDGEE